MATFFHPFYSKVDRSAFESQGNAAANFCFMSAKQKISNSKTDFGTKERNFLVILVDSIRKGGEKVEEKNSTGTLFFKQYLKVHDDRLNFDGPINKTDKLLQNF